MTYTVPQLGREDLDGMTPAEIEAARLAGQLEHVQGRPAPLDITGDRQLTTAEVRRLYEDRRFVEIDQARVAGRLSMILDGATDETISAVNSVD